MGFEYRKRTRGSKNGWMNFSYSRKNGLNSSVTVKSGNVTHNFGNRVRGSRTTINFGNGARYVSYGKTSKAGDGTIGIVGAALLVFVLFAMMALVVNFIWWAVGISIVAFAGYKAYRYVFHARKE